MDFVNIYTEDSSKAWILRRCATEIQKAYPKITINQSARAINYFINYALYRDVPGIKIGHFTHQEESGVFRKRFEDTISLYNYYTVMNKNTVKLLEAYGADPEKIYITRQGHDPRVKKQPVFGVVGRVYPSGRKGEHLVHKMVGAGYKVKAWGKGWGISDQISEWADLPEFYNSIDYLIVTSTNEGGPMPVVDAIASGVPVIAPDVGWCWEFPVYKYKKNSWLSLENLLNALTHPPSWGNWSLQHGKIFREVAKNEGII